MRFIEILAASFSFFSRIPVPKILLPEREPPPQAERAKAEIAMATMEIQRKFMLNLSDFKGPH